MRIIFFLIAMFALQIAPPAHGQNNLLVDSVDLTLLSKTGVERWNYLVDQALELTGHNNERALSLIKEAENSALTFGDSSCLVMCQRIRGQILLRLGNEDEALDVLQHALSVARRYRFAFEELAILVAYGNYRFYSSRYDEALQSFFQAHEISTDLQDTSYYELIQNNIGVIYYKLKDYRRALHYWEQASESEMSRGAYSHNRKMNLSLAYSNLGEFDNARKALSESILICGDGCSDEAKVRIYYASGTLYLGMKQGKLAKQNFLLS